MRFIVNGTISPKLTEFFKKKILPFSTIICIILFSTTIILATRSPKLARKTYISEQGLTIRNSKAEYSRQELQTAFLIQEQFKSLKNNKEFHDWFFSLLQKFSDDFFVHKFYANNTWQYNYCGIIRASKSPGIESVVFSSNYFLPLSQKVLSNDFDGFSIGLAFSLMDFFQYAKWKSKDIIFLFTNGESFKGVQEWLKEYHNPQEKNNNNFKRAGVIHAGIHLEMNNPIITEITLKIEGINGQLPNLDLINTITREIPYFPISLDEFSSETQKSKLNFIFNYLKSKNLQYFTNMIKNQALSIPTGVHSFFQSYKIDCVTIQTNSNPKNPNNLNPTSLIRFIGGIEVVFRDLSNLIEHLHQSFFYYLLIDPIVYIPIGDYSLSFLFSLLAIVIRMLDFYLNFGFGSSNHIIFILFTNVFSHLFGFASYLMAILFRNSQNWLVFHFGFTFITELIIFPIFRWIFLSKNSGKKNGINIWSGQYTYSGIIILSSLTFVAISNISLALIFSFFLVPIVLFIRFSQTKKFWNFLQSIFLLIFSPYSFVLLYCFLFQKNLFSVIDLLVDSHVLFGSLIFPFLIIIWIPISQTFIRILIQEK
ncbi:glycosylphosphatidylinositol anchor attachment 1 protein [Anaeramoeba ignava]|uniref:Glycosylphosphatidylinositol anchor attachment 1 protein n=1 Tax=Anaeramoeba ignava TaxID=1746090 RepID=A0A9Q0LGV6_ANAIG|nr:glycosylphosphatidylinositol anchor attachment 1 protein [Anaeramoeba ignava]